MKINNKYWMNDEDLIARIGYCPYHKNTKLDGWAECPACEQTILNYAKQKRSGNHGKNLVPKVG